MVSSTWWLRLGVGNSPHGPPWMRKGEGETLWAGAGSPTLSGGNWTSPEDSGQLREHIGRRGSDETCGLERFLPYQGGGLGGEW